jgi:hypothetical protein
VALKRARRARPQQTKYVNPKASRLVRIPTAKAKAAGANPNDICRTGVLESLHMHISWGQNAKPQYQISQTIELLTQPRWKQKNALVRN